MNKQELIEKIRALPYEEGVAVDTLKINRAGLIKLIDQFDEPQKVKIPKFVADWIEYCKNTFLSLALARALMIEEVDFYNYANQKDYFRLVGFLGSGINQEKFARAWFDGYEIEPEKRYTVKVRANGEYLNWSVMNTFYFSKKDKTYFVKSKLENAGFGWVFDCKGIEVKEVKE